MSPLYENRCLTVGQSPAECGRRGALSKGAKVGPIEGKIGSPDQGEPGVSLAQGLPKAHAAQGGITLGPEQGELGADFSHLGVSGKVCLGPPV
jgi:hypothetical protein